MRPFLSRPFLLFSGAPSCFFLREKPGGDSMTQRRFLPDPGIVIVVNAGKPQPYQTQHVQHCNARAPPAQHQDEQQYRAQWRTLSPPLGSSPGRGGIPSGPGLTTRMSSAVMLHQSLIIGFALHLLRLFIHRQIASRFYNRLRVTVGA